jgi:drug/metabolite transporter (DMT)-like permease
MAIGLAPVITKLSMSSVNSESFSVYWSLMAFVNASTLTICRRGIRQYRLFAPGWPWVVAMGVMVGVSVLAFTAAVNIAEPTIVAFFSHLESVFTVLLGMLLFKERLNRIEVLGAAATIAGALVMSYGAGQIVLLALMLTIVNAFASSASTLLAKVTVRKVEPERMIALSRLTGGLMALLYAVGMGVFQFPSPQTFLLMAVGSIIGPFLGFFLTYKALALGEVSKVTAVKSGFPFFVALYSFLIFGTVPGPSQAVGGAIIVVGVLTLIAGQYGIRSSLKRSAVTE